MLPLNKTLRRDWLDLFTHMVWASVIIIMGPPLRRVVLGRQFQHIQVEKDVQGSCEPV